MSMIDSILRRLRNKTVEREIDEQLRFHIDMRTRDNMAAGMIPSDAEADALGRFGDIGRVQAECREISNEMPRRIQARVINGITWMMLGCGLTLYLTGEFATVREVGRVLMMIAILWRLLAYLRARIPDQSRINQHVEPVPKSPLNLSVPAGDDTLASSHGVPISIVARDDQGRTPVERLISRD
jgi:hypothetical protein